MTKRHPDHESRFYDLSPLKEKSEITYEYIEKLKQWILENQDEYFSKRWNAVSFCDFQDFNKTSDREHLCLKNEVMLIDRTWEGKHCYVICTISEKRKARDLFKVIEISELKNWGNGYFLLPRL